MKNCTKCLSYKPLEEFYKSKYTKDGAHSRCKVCSNKASVDWYKQNSDVERLKKQSWRKRNPSKVKSQNRRDALRQYGLSLNDWEQIFNKQNGLCAICDLPETSTNRGVLMRLSVDHCHSTGKVRGLLCSKCNKAIGLFGDRPDVLRNAAKYLEIYKS